MLGIIKSKAEIAKGTLKVVFEVKEEFSFKAGQYCFVTLPSLKYPDERGPKRQFSIVNSPNEKGIITITTRVSDSGFKQTLKELPEGSQVQLGPIAGTFVLPYNAQDIPGFKPSQPLGLSTLEPLVFIAGGIGITPFMSILRYVSEKKLPYRITLIYSNRDQGSAAYLEELQNLESLSRATCPERSRRKSRDQIPKFKLILTMTEDPVWAGEKRKVDAQFIKDYFADVNAQYYMVVGPPSMVSAVEQELINAGVSAENIKIENFTGY